VIVGESEPVVIIDPISISDIATSHVTEIQGVPQQV
jgi:hypothetical protein